MIERSGWLPAVVIVSLGAALGYATWARHSDREVFAELRNSFDALTLQARFPAAGDYASDIELRLLSAGDTTSLAPMLAGRRAVVYFERMGCPFCDLFEQEMSRLSPSWKDSILVISLASHPDSVRGQFGVPKDDRKKVPGTPLLLIVDADGMIISSALGGKRVLGVMGLHGISAPSFTDMGGASAIADSADGLP